MMEPNFFEELMSIARGVNDDRLEGVAFEGYAHSLVRHGQPICIDFLKYDNVNRSKIKNFKEIMRQDEGSIDWKDLSVVKPSGRNAEECVVEMKSWAGDPSKLDYWTPARSTSAAQILSRSLQPLVDKNLPMRYIALLDEEEKKLPFRLDPVVIEVSGGISICRAFGTTFRHTRRVLVTEEELYASPISHPSRACPAKVVECIFFW